MQFLTPKWIIFFFGAIIIIGLFIYVLILRFKEEDKIDFKQHYMFLITYTILLVSSIYTWGIFYKMIWQTYQQVLTKSLPSKTTDE